MNVNALKAIGQMGLTAEQLGHNLRHNVRLINEALPTGEEAARNLTENLDRLRMPLPPKI